MANLAETATWESGIYQIETTDAVRGGATGVSNTPLKQLANRTAFLKTQFDALGNVESFRYAADTGGAANTVVITLAPVLTAHVVGMPIYLKPLHSNTGATTIAINGLAAVPVKRKDGSALSANDLLVGQMAVIMYDGTNYQLLVAAQPVYSKTEIDTLLAALAASIAQKMPIAGGTFTGNVMLPENDNPDDAMAVTAGWVKAGGYYSHYSLTRLVRFVIVGPISSSGVGNHQYTFPTDQTDIDGVVPGLRDEILMLPDGAGGTGRLGFISSITADSGNTTIVVTYNTMGPGSPGLVIVSAGNVYGGKKFLETAGSDTATYTLLL